MTPPLSAFHLPHAPLEFLSPKVLAADFLLRQLPLHHKLRGDSRVIHARQPKRAVAAHAVPAHQHVDLRVLEHVADVNRAGDVGRRQGNRKHRAVAGILGAKQLLARTRTSPSAPRSPAAHTPWVFLAAFFSWQSLKFGVKRNNQYTAI